MVFFFGLMTKEVVQATAPGGVLHPWRRALLPVIAAIGVTLVPTLIHTYLVAPLDEPMLASAWPVTLRHGSRARLLRRAADLRQAPLGDPVRDPAGYRV